MCRKYVPDKTQPEGKQTDTIASQRLFPGQNPPPPNSPQIDTEVPLTHHNSRDTLPPEVRNLKDARRARLSQPQAALKIRCVGALIKCLAQMPAAEAFP